MFSVFLPLWGVLDQIYYFFNRLQLVGSAADDNIFRVRLTKYRGHCLVTKDGQVIQTGDLMIKIHLYNYRLMQQMANIETNVRRALYVHQAVEKSMPGLAQYVSTHPMAGQIKGILGVTLLNRGVNKLGFETFDIKNRWYRIWKKSYMLPLYSFCSGRLPVNSLNKLDPKFLVISRDCLLSKYS